MRTFQVSLLSLTLGLSLSACKEDNPADESGESESGNTETGDGDGDAAGDGDGDDPTGDGDGDDPTGDGDGDEPTGDGDGDAAECGNSVVEADEACDDGNDVDDDECTNACELPACGDGILQDGEACDDGNTDSGDACTATCQEPGALIWEQYYDIDEGSDDVGYEVEIDSEGNINVVIAVDGEFRIAEFNADGDLQWDYATLDTFEPSLAIGSNDQLAVGGNSNPIQGATRQYDGSGNSQWTRNVAAADSGILGVGIDGMNRVYSAGFHAENQALLTVHDSEGVLVWSKLEVSGGSYGPLAVNEAGQAWAVRSAPFEIQTWTADGSAGWTSDALEDANYRDMVVDADSNVYVLSEALNQTLTTVTKFDSAGDLVWSVDHDVADQTEFASGLGLLPNGHGIIVAGGRTTDMGYIDAVLSWYDAEGDVPMPEIVIDGEDPGADVDLFFDIVVGDGYAVAVGAYDPVEGAADLWIRKFEI